MAVYKRGKKGVFHMDFTINGVRVTKTTKTSSKKEAKLIEATEMKRLIDEAKLSPQEKAARMLLSDAIKQVYQARWKTNKDGEFTHARALRLLELVGQGPVILGLVDLFMRHNSIERVKYIVERIR